MWISVLLHVNEHLEWLLDSDCLFTHELVWLFTRIWEVDLVKLSVKCHSRLNTKWSSCECGSLCYSCHCLPIHTWTSHIDTWISSSSKDLKCSLFPSCMKPHLNHSKFYVFLIYLTHSQMNQNHPHVIHSSREVIHLCYFFTLKPTLAPAWTSLPKSLSTFVTPFMHESYFWGWN